MKKFLAVLAVLVVLLSLSGCRASESKLLGQWEEERFPPGNFPYKFELFSNGTGWVDPSTTSGMYDCTWTAENGRIRIVATGLYSYAFSYKISGKKLYLINDNNLTHTYIKK